MFHALQITFFANLYFSFKKFGTLPNSYIDAVVTGAAFVTHQHRENGSSAP
jgi:hypothetical protein